MITLNKIENRKLIDLILLIVPLVIYVFFAFYDGVVICVDSPTYINMALSREPFYPTFLALNRWIFGANGEFYLQMVVLWQSLLMAYAVYHLAKFLIIEFKKSVYVGLTIEVICIATSLLCRFAAARSSMYSNSIMTEGICISLFLLFSAFVLEYLMNRSIKALVWASVCSFMMISSRKQMYITLILLVAAVIYVELIENKQWKKMIIYLCLTCCCIMGCNKALENIYSYAVHGQTSSHFNDNRFVATMLFFVAQDGDEEYINDPEIRRLYEDIYNTCVHKGFTQQSIEGNINQVVAFFGLHYDNIQIDTMWPMIEEHSQEKLGDNFNLIEREALTDQTTREIIMDLLPHTWTRIAYIFVGSCLHGYFNTVAKDHPVLNVYSTLIGIVFAGIFVWIVISDIKNTKLKAEDANQKHSLGEPSKESILAIYVLLAIALNIGIVALVIFCQTRYMIYNMPLFYIALLLMTLRVVEEKKSKPNDIVQKTK